MAILDEPFTGLDYELINQEFTLDKPLQ